MRLRWLPLALLALAPFLALALWPGVEAQVRAVIVLSTTLRTPLLSWAMRQLTDEPRIEEVEIAGSPATLARPGSNGPWPAIVFVNGATRLGRREPEVQDLARGLARAGYLVVVPDLGGLKEGALSDWTVEATVIVARAVAARPDVRGGRVGFVGVSLGGTLALLAAESPELAGQISLVAAIAPYTNLKEVIRLATTGYRRDGDLLIRYPTDPYVGLAVARSLAAVLTPNDVQRELVARLAEIGDDDPDPLAGFRTSPPSDLPPEAESVVALIANRDPRRFDELYAALPVGVRSAIAGLSPLARARQLQAPVELASAPQDKYFPVSQSRALVEKAPNARLTVTQAFAHVIPKPSLAHPLELVRFDGWVLRSLRDAAR
jgi:dienelactone hydrolase